MRLYHPEHGYHYPQFDSDIHGLKKLGWREEDGVQKEEEKWPVTLEEARVLWEERFGMKPHHAKKLKNLIKEIADADRT